MPDSLRFCKTCNLQFKEDFANRHTRSAVHRNAKLIRAMLERDGSSYAEIARRIGLTRERVRQLAVMMGFAAGKLPQDIRRTGQRKRTMVGFFLAAHQHGFSVEPINRQSGYINGKFCVQRQASWRKTGTSKYKYNYLTIYRPKIRFDICAWKLPDGRFLILPKDLVKFVQTIFNPEETQKPGRNSAAHYYRAYIEKWNVLGRPRASA